jgi:hypothetical protein
MPELSQTESEAEQALITNTFITNIKVQVPTPTSAFCGGLDPKFEWVTDGSKSSKKKRKAVRPLKSCGSRSFSSKESDFVN